MNPMHVTWVRVVLYVLSTVLAMLPASWAGLVAFDPETNMLMLSVPGIAAAVVTGLAGSAAVFSKWGIK